MGQKIVAVDGRSNLNAGVKKWVRSVSLGILFVISVDGFHFTSPMLCAVINKYWGTNVWLMIKAIDKRPSFVSNAQPAS